MGKAQTIKVLSYNTHMIFTAECKSSRAIKINSFLLKSGADVILLQEVYSKKIMRKLSKGFAYSITGVNNKTHSKKVFLIKSGLIVLSKYPLSNVRFHTFVNSKGIDSYSRKGIIMFDVLIETSNGYKTIKIANTHLQNNYHPITVAQINEVKLFTQEADIVAGDFNYENFDYISNELSKQVTITVGQTGFTYKKETIDYIFSNKPLLAHTTYNNLLGYSDHNAIESDFDLCDQQ